MKIHYHTDCYFFAGCENIIANILNNDKFVSENEVSISYPNFRYYIEGFKQKVTANNITEYPLILPDYPKLSYWMQKHNVNTFVRRMMGLPIFILEYFYVFTIYDIVRLYLLFCNIKPDVIHINNGGYPAATSCRAAVISAKLAGIPKVIFHVNNIAADVKTYNPSKRIVERLFDQIVSENVNVFITGSNFARMKLSENRVIPIDKILNINNTFIPRKIIESPESVRGRLGIDKGDIVFGIVAILDKRKGHKVLIDAMNILSARTYNFDNIKLLIVGSGEEEAALKHQVKELKLEKNIRFISHQNNIFDIHNIIDVLVLPSIRDEDFPYVIIEAMSLGKPIIGTDLAGIPEEIKDGVNGFVVLINDSGSLAQAMLQFIQNRGFIQTMGIRGKRIFETKFEYNITIQKILKLYGNI